jgi:hypothetical protein
MDHLKKQRLVDPVLTELSLGYTNAEMVGPWLFPIAEMEKEGGKIPQFTREAFRIHNTQRALRAKSNRISPETIEGIDVVLEEHDLEYPIDYREDADSAFALQEHATEVVTEGIQLRREKFCADIAQNPASYPAGNKIALGGSSQFTDKSSDPIGVIEDGKDAIRGRIGKRPNTMVIGAQTRKALRNHPQIIERIKYSMKGVITLDLMREIFEVENIVCGEAVYSSEFDEFDDLWTDNIILAYVKPMKMATPQAGRSARNYRDPSFGYTLRKKGQPMIDRYTEGGKLELVRNTDIFKVQLVGADAGYLISNTNA